MRNYLGNLDQDSVGQCSNTQTHTHTHTHTDKGLLAFWRGKIPLFLMMFFGGLLLTMNSCVQESVVNPSSQKTTKTIDLRDGDQSAPETVPSSGCYPPSSQGVLSVLRYTGTDEIHDIPGFCTVKVSYEIWYSHVEGFYQLDNVDVDEDYIETSCAQYALDAYNQCVIDCTPAGYPPPPGCIQDCVLAAKEALEVAIRDYILDKYILEVVNIGPCPFTNEAVAGRFSRISCRSYCLSSPTGGISFFDYKEVECGTGCCLYKSTYCKWPSGEIYIFKSKARSLIVCDDSNTVFDCQNNYGLNYHTPCESYDCVNRQ